MASYYDALTTKWATLSGTTNDKLVAINALTVAGPAKDVSASSVIGYLALNAKLSGLLAYAAAPPQGAQAVTVVAAKELAALLSMPSFTTFYLSDPQVAAGVQVFLNALAGDAATGIAAADVTALLALGNTTIPWWASAGYSSSISLNDLGAAGGLS
jgi:hypothetical protein